MEFTRKNLKEIRADIDEALVGVGEKYGIELSAKNASFTPNTCTFKLELGVVGSDGVTSSKEAESYKVNAGLFGLDPNWLGETFTANGKTFKVIGLNTRAKKYPVVVQEVGSDGRYKFSAEGVVRAFRE